MANDPSSDEPNGSPPAQDGAPMVDVVLRRIVYRDGQDRQYIYLAEREGRRGFPIVIGSAEAGEIRRVVEQIEPERPLTHRLCYETITALGASIRQVDIVDLRRNTFYARVVLQDADGQEIAEVDARPSDAIALALRASCPIRVAESVMESAGEDLDGPG